MYAADWANGFGSYSIQSYPCRNQNGLYYLCGLFRTQRKNLVPIIAATPDLTDVQLPMGCKYLVLDKNYQMRETSLEGEDLDRAMEYALSGKINENLNKQYLFVTRENEYVVLQYYIGSQFIDEWFYNHFPSPEILLYILMGINCVAVCVILTAKFAKNMRAQLSPLLKQQKKWQNKILILRWDTQKSKNLKMCYVLSLI